MTNKLATKITTYKEIGEQKRSNGIISLCCSIGGLVVNEHLFSTTKTKLIKKGRKGEKRDTEDEECLSSEINKFTL